MKISIKRSINQELDCFKIKIKLISKGIYVAIVLFIVAILVIIICRNDFGINDKSLLIYIFFEFILFTISFIIFKRIHKNKKVYNDFVKTATKEYADKEIYSTINIDDQYFTYESLRKYYKLSWSSLSMYQVYNSNLILMIDNYNNSFIIKNTELKPDEFRELHAFVAQRLILRKK